MITITPEAIEAIRIFLEKQGRQKPIRIHLQSTGCCDASLGLMMDNAHSDDLVENIQDVTFVVRPEVIGLTGDITISYENDKFKTGFIMNSERPVNEWTGFGVCSIKE